MKMHEPEDPLARGLRAVAEDDEQLGTSSAVAMRLMAEVQRIAAARRRRTMVWSLTAAAAVLAIIFLLAGPVAGPRRLADTLRGTRPTLFESQQATQSQSVGAPVISRELVTEFFPLAYSNVPTRGGYVVRMQVPRSALASFVGATQLSNGGSAQVLADVVVGDDGLARAVRFVQIVSNDKQEQTP